VRPERFALGVLALGRLARGTLASSRAAIARPAPSGHREGDFLHVQKLRQNHG
jgi:hypothetical protein